MSGECEWEGQGIDRVIERGRADIVELKICANSQRLTDKTSGQTGRQASSQTGIQPGEQTVRPTDTLPVCPY